MCMKVPGSSLARRESQRLTFHYTSHMRSHSLNPNLSHRSQSRRILNLNQSLSLRNLILRSLILSQSASYSNVRSRSNAPLNQQIQVARNAELPNDYFFFY